MTGNDHEYVRRLIAAGVIGSPCLEAGAGLDEHSARALLGAHGIAWTGTDLEARAPDVVAVDLGGEPAAIDAALAGRRFASVLLLNVIEHVFEPLKVMDNACRLLEPGGTLVVVVPTAWPLHYYPLDCWRVMPNLFEEYAARRGLELLQPHFVYVAPEIRPICRDAAGKPVLPPPTSDRLRALRSRLVHRAFDTFGRGMSSPAHVSVGAVLRTPRPS